MAVCLKAHCAALPLQVAAELTPLSASKVGVQFITFKIFGLIPIKAPPSARGACVVCYGRVIFLLR
jgi:hypothetical protein